MTWPEGRAAPAAAFADFPPEFFDLRTRLIALPALKILLLEGDVLGYGVLQRNEVVALVNTLAQLAKSVDSIRDWQRRDVRKAHAHFAVCCFGV